MEDALFNRVDVIYRYVRRMTDADGERQRIARRQRDALRTELIVPEQAQLHDLNRVLSAAAADAAPVCRSLGVRLRLWQALDLPRVPLLVEPLHDTFSGLIDLCLDEDDVAMLELRSWGELDRVVAQIDQHVHHPASCDNLHWSDLRLDSRLELVIGGQVLRAMGGRMTVRARAGALRARIELPRGDSRLPLGARASSQFYSRPPVVENITRLS